MVIQRLNRRWRRVCLPAAALSAVLAGCSLPGKNSNEPFGAIEPVTAASYQEHIVVEEAPRKIEDPLTLKLHYARWMEEMENFDDARTNYEVVLQQRPEEIEAILGLARIDLAAGSFDTAEAGFRKALELQPNSAPAQNALGQFYVSRGRHPEGLRLLNRAVTTDPSNKAFRFQLAVALARSGDATASYAHFVQAVGEPTAHYNLGMILCAQGQYAQAEQHLLQSLSRKPDFEPAQQALRQVRQQAQNAGTYASQPRRRPQIQQAGHSRPGAVSARTQQPYRNNRR